MGVAVSCGVGCRRSSDPALLWLWCRLAAVAPIQPLAWEHLYAMGAALKTKRKKKKKTHKEPVTRNQVGNLKQYKGTREKARLTVY